MKQIVVLYALLRRIFYKFDIALSWIVTWFQFKLNGVSFTNDYLSRGRPSIKVELGGKFNIGKKLTINNGTYYNKIGRQQQCFFVVGPKGTLTIGDYVGASSIAIVCNNAITIGNHVKIGGNVVIYDTDFHSLNSADRSKLEEDITLAETKPIIIEDYVFIGAHSTILKGVVIGQYSIVGACSVITKNIPAGEIWAGNPAKFIRKHTDNGI
jgi:acetyltransferase-like isoleucine patch superfamily enzyme